jgi:hypothetical protein
MAKKIMNDGFDLTSNPTGRVFSHYLLSRFIPMGVYQGGAGLKCLLIFTVTHYFGRPIFWFVARFEPQMARLYRLKERLK